jgi:hypothetical protein
MTLEEKEEEEEEEEAEQEGRMRRRRRRNIMTRTRSSRMGEHYVRFLPPASTACRFFTALSVRPVTILAISVHLLPCRVCPAIRGLNSSTIQLNLSCF